MSIRPWTAPCMCSGAKATKGASLPDLTAAMGINRPSLYAAFGNKGSVVSPGARPLCHRARHLPRAALNEPTARAAVERLLTGTADGLTDSCHPRGCLIVQAALSCSDTADPIRPELIARRAAVEWAIRQRLERGQAEGELPADAKPADLARFCRHRNSRPSRASG